MKVVIIANLKKDKRSVALYEFLKSMDHEVAYYYQGVCFEELKSYDVVRDIRSIKNSMIVLYSGIKNYFMISRTNKIIYMYGGSVDADIPFMLPMVDRIICDTYNDSYSIMNKLAKLKLEKPIVRLLPLVQDPEEYVKPDKTPRIMIMGCPDPEFDFNYIKTDSNYDVLVYGGDNVSFILSNMARGVTVVVKNIPKFGEFIVNGINGLILDNFKKADLSYANRVFIRENAISYCNLHISTWYDSFNRLLTTEGSVIDLDIIDINTRYWVVPKTTISGSEEIIELPKHKDRLFKEVRLNDIEEIMLFFSQQRFNEVIIYDWDYGEDDHDKINRVMDAVNSYGARSINFYWATDKPIPSKWSKVFQRMTLLAISEANKRVVRRSQIKNNI